MTKILLIDDEPDIVVLLKYILKEEGYEVRGAEGCPSALEILKEVKPDLILLDFMMPDFDGWQTLARIRELDDMKHVPVAFLTARVLSNDILANEKVGDLVDYIEKPFTTAALMGRIAAILEGLENIRSKKIRLEEAGADPKTLGEFELVARAEALHKNILRALERMLEREERPKIMEEIKRRIVSQRLKVENFVKRREEFEGRFEGKGVDQRSDFP